MKLTEVIAALNDILQQHPEAADCEVNTEGCDCFGDVGSVDYDGHTVSLYRTSHHPNPEAAETALGKLATLGLSMKPKEHVKIWPEQS